MGIGKRIGITLEMIKWEHSVFALPFALTGALLAAHGVPALRILGWILVAMVSARSAAMAFNRWADAGLDAANPRTSTRAIPAGLLTRGFVLAFTLIMVGVFLLAAWRLNRLTLELAPLVLLVLLGYSYMKRVTRWTHLVLGVALGIEPSAAVDCCGDGQPGLADWLMDLRSGDVLGGGVRHSLCLPGYGA